MLETIDFDGQFKVNSMGFRKKVIGNLSNYITIKRYPTFLNYLTESKRELKKKGFNYVPHDIMINEEVFEQYKKSFVHPNYSIVHNELFNECWVITTFSKTALVRIFRIKPIIHISDTDLTIPFINHLLLDYGVKDQVPKFELVSILP